MGDEAEGVLGLRVKIARRHEGQGVRQDLGQAVQMLPWLGALQDAGGNQEAGGGGAGADAAQP